MKSTRFFKSLLLAGLSALGLTAAAAPLSGAVSTVGTLCLGATGEAAASCTAQDVSTLR